jgi:hypothetical protein
MKYRYPYIPELVTQWSSLDRCIVLELRVESSIETKIRTQAFSPSSHFIYYPLGCL